MLASAGESPARASADPEPVSFPAFRPNIFADVSASFAESAGRFAELPSTVSDRITFAVPVSTAVNTTCTCPPTSLKLPVSATSAPSARRALAASVTCCAAICAAGTTSNPWLLRSRSANAAINCPRSPSDSACAGAMFSPSPGFTASSGSTATRSPPGTATARRLTIHQPSPAPTASNTTSAPPSQLHCGRKNPDGGGITAAVGIGRVTANVAVTSLAPSRTPLPANTSRSATIAFAVWYRSSGSRFSALSRTCSRAAGNPAIGSGSLDITAYIVERRSPPSNSLRPVSISCRITPADHRSARASVGSPIACSGAIYAAVPSVVPGVVSSGLPCSFASPKSRIFRTPRPWKIRFPGLMSRCTMPCACASASPRASCSATPTASPDVIGPRAIRSASVGPA